MPAATAVTRVLRLHGRSSRIRGSVGADGRRPGSVSRRPGRHGSLSLFAGRAAARRRIAYHAARVASTRPTRARAVPRDLRHAEAFAQVSGPRIRARSHALNALVRGLLAVIGPRRAGVGEQWQYVPHDTS